MVVDASAIIAVLAEDPKASNFGDCFVYACAEARRAPLVRRQKLACRATASGVAARTSRGGRVQRPRLRSSDFERLQALPVERENRSGEVELEPGRPGARRHFALRLDEDVEHFVARVLGGEILRVEAQEHKAGDILERLRLAVAAQILLAHERPNSVDRRLVVAAARHDLNQALRVSSLGLVAPGDIAGLALWKVATRALPALDMLPAHSDPERLGRFRREAGERLAHPPAVSELGRLLGLRD